MSQQSSSVNIRRPKLPLNFASSTPDSTPLEFIRSYSSGTLTFSPNEIYRFTSADLIDEGEIGRGSFGTVSRMVHSPSAHVIAVKRIRSNTVNTTEQKRLLMELEAITNSSYPHIVQFYGAIFKEGDCWICMELMDVSLDKLYKQVYDGGGKLPEEIIGFCAVSMVNALSYLKEVLEIIHRDVKPSNILLDRKGNIKLCDFGIAGHLIDSIAKSQDAGCRPYMAPERLKSSEPYDVRADVWSLGISLLEISTGKFPFAAWESPFQQLQEVADGDPPVMKPDPYSAPLVNFINYCLIKGKEERPKYKDLMAMDFYKTYNTTDPKTMEYAKHIVGDYVTSVLDNVPRVFENVTPSQFVSWERFT
ncbi:hypothetical protein AB6A40_006585 [Gnathostoma spinigerum]|uniref:mitogen-activated protein kinase kinase n=1 Tax=Gnathostoma spinigerum TaxID=75299 RepID=A0ABD6EKU7_9BILA